MYGTRFDYLRLPPFIGEQMLLDDSQILVGQGSQAIRKIFRNQQYNAYEQQQLNSFKNRLNQLQEYNPQLHTDDILLRFLYANQFNINKANEQFIFSLDWLTKPGIIELTEEVETFYRKGAAYIGGRTKDNKPSIVIHTKLVDNLKILDKALAILCAITEDYMFYSGKVESWVLIIETSDQSVFQIPIDSICNTIGTLQNIFPNTCDSIYIINPSLSLNLQWSQFENYIAPNTLNKIKFLKKNEIPILSNQFAPDQLEKGLGGDRFMQSYWPPDPNYFMQSIPIQFEQPQQVQQEEVIFEPHYEIPQYVPPPPPQPVEQPPPKKKCICVKCSKDLEDANAQPKDPKAKEAKPKPQPQATLQQSSQPPSKNEEPYRPIDKSKPNMDDTYLSYQRKYDSLIDDSSMLIPRYTEQPSIQPDEETKAYPEKEFGGSSFKKDSQPERKEKPTFGNPYFNESARNSVASSQQLNPKQQPRTQTYATQTNQPYDNEDERPYIQIPQRQQQRQNDQYQTPQLQYGSQQSIQVQRQPQQYYVQSPPPQQYQQQYIQQPPQQQYQQPIQPQYYIPSPPPQQQYVQPQYEQSQVYPQAQSHYPQAIPSYYPDYQVVQASVQDFEPTQYQPNNTNKLPKNYDLSEFEKYNISDNNNKIFTPYDQQIDKQTYQTPWKPIANEQSYVPGQTIYPEQPYSTYKPKESNSAYTPNQYTPNQYTPYDYNIDNYIPTYAQTEGTNKPNQLYSQKPGQQACSIQ